MKEEEEKKDLYAQLGVASDKSDVANAFASVNDNDYPGCFCNVVDDEEHPGMVVTKHADGVGSGSQARYLTYLETGDSSVLQGDVMCATQMNMGDIGACGFHKRIIYITNTIAINGNNIDEAVLRDEIALGFQKFRQLHESFGFKFRIMGGETAGLVRQTQSYIFDVDVHSSLPFRSLIKGNVQPGDKNWGFSSGGFAFWEDKKNSGGMSNGKTLSQTVLLHESYNRMYPFLTTPKAPYKGRFRVGDTPEGLEMTVDQALNSPTRQWSILIKMLIEELESHDAIHLLHGISMNTGGGCTKVGNLGSGIAYIKKMPEVLPFFQLIQSESGELWKNMYRSFNCGVGLDVVGSPENGILAAAIATISTRTNVKSFELGECFGYSGEGNLILLQTQYGDFKYYVKKK